MCAEPQRDQPLIRALPSALRNDYVWAAAVLALLLGLFFSPLVRFDATFSSVANFQRLVYPWAAVPAVDRPMAPFYPQSDQATYIHPRQVFLDQELKGNDQLPLWDPQSLAGTPFFSQSGSRLAYPPLIALTMLLPPSWVHDVYVIVHLFLAGLAAFALMKHLGARFAGSLLTAVAWMLSSYALSWIMIETFASVAVMLPVALLFVRRAHDRSSWADLGVGALAAGLLVLGTSVDLALFGFLPIVGYAGALAAGRLIREWSHLGARQRLAVMAGPAALTVGALAFAAPALLPFLQLSGRSLRVDVPTALRTSVAPTTFLRSFLPPEIPTDFSEAWTALNGYQVFAGTLTACLAVVGLFLRRPGAALGRSLVILSFVFLAFPPVQHVVGFFLPVLGKLASPGRGLFLWGLGLAVLAGLALDALLRRLGTIDRVRRRATRDSKVSLGGYVIPVVVTSLCVAVTGAQLLTYGRRVNPPFQRRVASQLFPSTPAIKAVRGELGPGPGQGRVLGVSTLAGEALVASTAMTARLRAANGYETVVPANIGTLWRTVAGETLAAASAPSPFTFIPRFPHDTMRTDLLGRVGVAAVVGPPASALGPNWAPDAAARQGLRPVYSGTDGTVFEVVDHAPRAVVVGNAEWAGSAQDALRRFSDPSFDVRRTVVLQGSPRPLAGQSGEQAVPSSVTWLQDDPNQLRLSVTAGKEAWLVLLDSWDPDWEATVDGRDTRVRRADFGFRAVPVPAGTSKVTFTYRPMAAIVGASISFVASTGVMSAVLLGWRRRRRFPEIDEALSSKRPPA